MNIETLVKLAEEDNDTLVALVSRWMTSNKNANPVSDAIIMEKARDKKEIAPLIGTLSGVSFIAVMLTIGGISIASIFPPPIRDRYLGTLFGITTITGFFIGLITYLIYLWKVKQIKSECVDGGRLDDFCFGVTMLENLMGSPWFPKEAIDTLDASVQERAKRWEGNLVLTQLEQVANDDIRKENIELIRLQGIPWRKQEARMKRDNLLQKHSILYNLLVTIPAWKELFKDESGEGGGT